jgi:hypothetical protein
MQIKLTRKLADYLDGIDLSTCREGEVVDLPRIEAQLLIAECWAVPFYAPPNEIRSVSSAVDRSMADDDLARRIQTVEQLHRVSEQMDKTRFEQHECRRAEDRYREELHDSRAKTVDGHS